MARPRSIVPALSTRQGETSALGEWARRGPRGLKKINLPWALGFTPYCSTECGEEEVLLLRGRLGLLHPEWRVPSCCSGGVLCMADEVGKLRPPHHTNLNQLPNDDRGGDKPLASVVRQRASQDTEPMDNGCQGPLELPRLDGTRTCQRRRKAVAAGDQPSACNPTVVAIPYLLCTHLLYFPLHHQKPLTKEILPCLGTYQLTCLPWYPCSPNPVGLRRISLPR